MCEADANAVELGRMNKYFYEFGRYISSFDRVGYIGPMLVDVSVILPLFHFVKIRFSDMPSAIPSFDGLVQGKHE